MAVLFNTLLVAFSLTASVELSPASFPADRLLDDLHALRKALIDNGGLPGTLGVIRKHDNSSSDIDNDNCTNWSYDNTTIFPSGKFRHEHFSHFYAGFYGERFVDNPYVVHYVSGPLGILLTKRLEFCVVHEWGVVECDHEGTKTHYVFHDHPQMGCQDVPQKITDRTALPDGTLLEERVGVLVPKGGSQNFTTSELNVLPLLDYFGGAPGLVTARRVKPFNFNMSLDEIDDEARDEWLYEYRFSNVSTALRFEHAFLRSDDIGDLYEDFQGSMYWRSADGDFFIQYRRNNTGFYANTQRAKIAVYRSLWAVTLPLDPPVPVTP